MIRLERAGAEDLETSLRFKELALRLSMTNTRMNMIPIWRIANESNGN